MLSDTMDPLTHTATGLFLSRIGLKRWTPLATPILLLAANAPDIDIVSAAGGSLSYLHYHRHLTHSLLAMPVMAIGTVALVALVARKTIHWAGAFFAALIAVATHLLLDLTNTYGIRLFLPFSARWLRLDITNVVDIWIWAVFLVCVVGPYLAALVGSEIASRHTRRTAAGARLRLARADLPAALQLRPRCTAYAGDQRTAVARIRRCRSRAIPCRSRCRESLELEGRGGDGRHLCGGGRQSFWATSTPRTPPSTTSPRPIQPSTQPNVCRSSRSSCAFRNSRCGACRHPPKWRMARRSR